MKETGRGNRRLPGDIGKLEIDSQVAIHLHRCGQVELCDWNLPMIHVSDIKRVFGEDVVLDLLRSAAVLEDERDLLTAFRGLRLT